MPEKTNIQVTMDTWRALNARKERPNETFNDIIQRLLDEPEHDTDPTTTDETIDETTEPDGVDEAEPGDEIGAVVEQLDIPGRSLDDRDARRATAREYLAWVRREQEVTRSDVQRGFATADMLEQAGYNTADSFWENFGRPVLDDCIEIGVVEKPHSRAYRWTG